MAEIDNRISEKELAFSLRSAVDESQEPIVLTPLIPDETSMSDLLELFSKDLENQEMDNEQFDLVKGYMNLLISKGYEYLGDLRRDPGIRTACENMKGIGLANFVEGLTSDLVFISSTEVN